jgi:uncharacterized protein YabN with tetrapyrrole methylase and pyrophosphatase domain
MEQLIEENNLDIRYMNLNEMDKFWEQAKILKTKR